MNKVEHAAVPQLGATYSIHGSTTVDVKCCMHFHPCGKVFVFAV